MCARSGNQLPRGYGMVKFLWLTWLYKMQIHQLDIHFFFYMHSFALTDWYIKRKLLVLRGDHLTLYFTHLVFLNVKV